MLSNHSRRHFFQVALALLGNTFSIAQAALPMKLLRDTDQRLNAAIKQLLAGRPCTDSQAILIQMPDLAEDGGNVPITITSSLADVRLISIFSDQNPLPLIAVFKFSTDMEAFVKTRIKMAGSGKVIILLQAGERFYRAERALQIVLGGCDVQSADDKSPGSNISTSGTLQ